MTFILWRRPMKLKGGPKGEVWLWMGRYYTWGPQSVSVCLPLLLWAHRPLTGCWLRPESPLGQPASRPAALPATPSDIPQHLSSCCQDQPVWVDATQCFLLPPTPEPARGGWGQKAAFNGQHLERLWTFPLFPASSVNLDSLPQKSSTSKSTSTRTFLV